MNDRIGDMEVTLHLRPARIQRAAESAVEHQIANLNRVLDVPDEERAEIEAAIRRLAEPRPIR